MQWQRTRLPVAGDEDKGVFDAWLSICIIFATKHPSTNATDSAYPHAYHSTTMLAAALLLALIRKSPMRFC